jgi:diguanylate cyclase (GGDEF)-like protein
VEPLNPRMNFRKNRWMRSAFFLVLTLSLTFFLGWLDYRMESEVILSVFYLIPIFLSAWFLNEWTAVVISLLCGALAAYDREVLSGEVARNIWIAAWAVTSRLMVFLFTVWVLGRLRRSLESIREMAITDSLTGAYNARAFFELLQKEIERSQRYGHPLSLMYLDIDDFKMINDSLGHQTGNSILAAVAAALRSSVRRMDIVARLGGDEFSVLLPETDNEAARRTVARLQQASIRDTARYGHQVTISVGVVTYYRMDVTADDIIRKADDLMYRVKRSGKNGVLFEIVPA